MDDNAPVHKAHAVQNYKDEHEIISTEWPAQSSDLNIIENVWPHIKRKLQKSKAKIAIENDLFRAIQTV